MSATKAYQKTEQRSVPLKGIGTKNESSLHRSLKFRYSDEAIEKPLGSYVCDGQSSDGEIIEVQTGSFGPLKEKLNYFVQLSKVRIIHPIINEKLIELYDAEGRIIHRRKSPRKGSAWDLFKALIYAPELPLKKNIILELAVVDITEKRIADGKGSWRRKGVRIADRSLSACHRSIVLSKPDDYRQFIPFKKKEPFNVRDLGEKAGINTALARKTLYVLSKIGLVQRTGKCGRAYIYQLKK